MQIFQNNDSTTFYFNNRKYVKNYHILKIGDTHIGVYNAYDTKLQLLSSTHFSQVEVDGEIYDNQQELMDVLSPILFVRKCSITGNSATSLSKYQYLGLVGGNGPLLAQNVASYVNGLSVPLIVGSSVGQVLLEFKKKQNGAAKKYVFMFDAGEGSWGGGGTPVDSSNFKMLSSLPIYPEEIEEDESNVINSLGEVEDGDYIAIANQEEWQFTDIGKTYYFTYSYDEALYFSQFIGEYGIYGGDEGPEFTSNDFVDTTNSNLSDISTAQQVFDSGSIIKLDKEIDLSTTNDETTTAGVKLSNGKGALTSKYQISGTSITSLVESSAVADAALILLETEYSGNTTQKSFFKSLANESDASFELKVEHPLGNTGLSFNTSNNRFQLEDDINYQGVIYKDDYSANFIDRSLVDKGYVDEAIASIGTDGGIATGLERINESSGGYGWRLIGRDPANYGNLGQQAIDFSHSDSPSSTMGATGQLSTAFGYNSVAEGTCSFVAGQLCHANNFSTALGANTSAYYYSFAAGADSHANGNTTFAFGRFAQANAAYSASLGYKNIAIGQYSFASGIENTASNYGETVIGPFAAILTGQSNSFSTTSTAFRVGIGSGDSDRNDGLRVYNNGLVYTPNASLEEISGATSKVLATKEYVDAAISNVEGSGVSLSKYGNIVVDPSLGNVISIPHTLGSNPEFINLTFSVSNTRLKDYSVTTTASHIIITFASTPTDNNVRIWWEAKL